MATAKNNTIFKVDGDRLFYRTKSGVYKELTNAGPQQLKIQKIKDRTAYNFVLSGPDNSGVQSEFEMPEIERLSDQIDKATRDTGWLTPKKQLAQVYWRRRDNEPSVRLYYRRVGATVFFMVRGNYIGDIPGVKDGYQDDTYPELKPEANRGEKVALRRCIGWALVCFKDKYAPDNKRGFPITNLDEMNADGSGRGSSRVPEGFRPIFPQEIKCRTEFKRNNADKSADDWIKAKGAEVNSGANIPLPLVATYGGKYRYDKFDEMIGYFFISAKSDSNCVMQLRNFRVEENLSDLKFNGVSWITDDAFPSEQFLKENFYKVTDFDRNYIKKNW